MSASPPRPAWYRRWLQRLGTTPPPPAPLDAVAAARALVAAVDAGGLPLNPARLNQIARGLGLEVSRHARPEDTIERIRAALSRLPG